MPHSFAQTADRTCPTCRQPFPAEVWLIVDAAERPDLLDRIRNGALHDLPCPHCGHAGSVDAPLLVFRPGDDPPLIFVPAQNTTAHQNGQQVAQLLAILKESVGAAWRDEWVAASDTLDWLASNSTHSTVNTSLPDELRAILTKLSQPARLADMPRRIELCRRAIALITQEDQPQRWAALQNELGNSLAQNPLGSRAENLEQAIHHYQQALEVYSRHAFPADWAMTQNNLANAYLDRIRGERAENLEQAIHHYQQALEVQALEQLPADHRRTQANLGNLYFSERRWAEADTALQAARAAGQLLLTTAYTETGRRAEVAAMAQLFARLAFCRLKRNHPDQALLTLEQGKTRLLTQALAFSGADLEQLPSEQRQTIQQSRETIRQLEAEMRLPPATPGRRSDRNLAPKLGQARTELNQFIATIRQEHTDFMPAGLDLSDLLALIPPGGALVAPLVTSQGSAIFIMPTGAKAVTEDHILWLDEITDETVRSWLIGTEAEPGWLRRYFDYRHQRGAVMANLLQIEAGQRPASESQETLFLLRAIDETWQKAIEQIADILWESLISPIHDRLQTLLAPQAPLLLMPSGGLGLLPLHAARREENGQQRYWLEDYTITYAPSGYALQASQRRLQEPHRQQRTLLAVIDPTHDLPFSPIEGQKIAELFGSASSTLFQKDEATLSAIKGAADRSHLHFSCHGAYGWNDPFQSGLALANQDRLTLAHLIGDFDLPAARLVVLSACETNITDISQSPDEFLGLPAGFMQAGAPGVVGTLWAVNALSTPLLMEQFYHYYLQDGMSIATALRQAQLWLRTVTAAALRQRFAVGRHAILAGTSRLQPTAVLQAYRYFAGLEPGERPYAHPYYWAAFTFSGA